jgi:glutamate/tyrosine decarboxylase-like PLP-dependent enzyme
VLRRHLHTQPEFEVAAEGPLSITCFRFRPPALGSAVEAVDALNRRVLEAVQTEGDVFLTGTELAGRFALRACIVNFRTTELDLIALLDAVRRAAERVLASQ